MIKIMKRCLIKLLLIIIIYNLYIYIYIYPGARISYKPDAAEGDICDGQCINPDCATAPSKINH